MVDGEIDFLLMNSSHEIQPFFLPACLCVEAHTAQPVEAISKSALEF